MAPRSASLARAKKVKKIGIKGETHRRLQGQEVKHSKEKTLTTVTVKHVLEVTPIRANKLCKAVAAINTRPGPVFTKILTVFLRITLKSERNSLLRFFLFLE